MKAIVIVTAVLALGVGVAFADNPHDIVPSLTVNETNLHYGDAATFTTEYPKINGRYSLRVRVLCYQDELVYQYSTDEDAAVFVLSGGLWTGGAAHCEADLYYFTLTGYGQQTGVFYLAHTEFEVAA